MIRVGVDPFTNSIMAGTVTKRGLWGKNKTDVTMDALLAVVTHALEFGEPIEITKDGKLEFVITVEDFRLDNENN